MINAGLRDVLKASIIGYETKTVFIAGKDELDISLSKITTQLSEVVVTALGIRRKRKPY